MGYNKIILHGGQICDYLHVQKNDTNIDNFQYVNVEPTEWDENTLLSAKFNGDLVAGNSSLLEEITGYEVRRRKGANSYSEYVGRIKGNTETGAINYMIDYLVENKMDYTYYLYPSSTNSKTDSGIILSPSVSDEVKTNWGHWSLLVVDESDEENIFYLSKMFKFELNLTTDDMSNNAVVNVIQNFTKYPIIQHGTSNYWSNSLTALCGFISCNDDEYIQTPNMIRELKSLTSDTRRKFLKDIDGNVYEVDITAPINISTMDETIEKVKSVKISWTEVGEVDGISVINNPEKSSTSWLLTETGEVVSCVDYVWGDHYKWDNSYRWTEQNNLLKNATTNAGRDIVEQKGDD